MCTAKWRAARKAPILAEVRARLQSTMGGDSDTELKLFAVTPTGLPAASVVVTIVTPVVTAPSACRKRFESKLCCMHRLLRYDLRIIADEPRAACSSTA